MNIKKKVRVLLLLLALFTLTSLFTASTYASDTAGGLGKRDVYYGADGEEITGCTPVKRDNWYKLTDFDKSIDKTGRTDISDILQSCIDVHQNVLIPKGTYLVSKAVTLKSGSGIKGENGTVILTEGNTLFNSSDDIIKDVSIKKLKVESSVSTKRAFVLYIGSVYNLEMSEIDSFGIGTVQIYCSRHGLVDGKTREEMGENAKYISNGITISDCVCDGGDAIDVDVMIGQYGVPVGIHFDIVDNIIIENCEVFSMCHGIQFFGGVSWIPEDTEEAYEKHIKEVGQVTNCMIYGCYVHDVPGGGIWGTCADDLTIENTEINNCLDVNLDFESCDNILVKKCKIVDGYSGAEHSMTGTIEFSENEFIHSLGYDRYYFLTKGTDDSVYAWENQHIIVRNNTFTSYGKIGEVDITLYKKPSLANFTFENNTCFNTIVRAVALYPSGMIDAPDTTSELDLWKMTVKNNTFDFSILPNTNRAPAAIYANVGATRRDKTEVIIRGNKISASVEGSFVGIDVNNAVTGRAFSAECVKNVLKGCIMQFNNASGVSDCSATIIQNECDDIRAFGDIAIGFSKNVHSDGSKYGTDELAADSLLVAPEIKTEKGTLAAVGLPKNIGTGVDGSEEALWRLAPSYALSNEDGDGKLRGECSVLYGIDDGRITVSMLLKVESDTPISDKAEIKVIASLDNTVADITADSGDYAAFTLSPYAKSSKGNPSRVILSQSGGLISDNAGSIIHSTVVSEDEKSFVTEVKVFVNLTSEMLDRLAVGSNDFFFDVVVSDGIDYVGFTGKKDIERGEDLGIITLVGNATVRYEESVIAGDVNSDGAVKGNDATLLLKYLAGWDVTVDEIGADVNGNGEIKGNDATLLLKYLAGWDVVLG